MKIGLITKEEEYWGLRIFSKRAAEILKNYFDTKHLKITDKTDVLKIQKFYADNDLVISLSSKSISYDRKFPKPTIFFAYGWLDHGAGINLYYNRKFFQSNDILIFASRPSQQKYEHVYQNPIKSFVVPFFTSVKRNKLSLKEIAKLKKRYGISKDKKILVYFGRLCQEKNILELLYFAKLLGEDFCLLLVGQYSDIFTYGFNSTSKEQYRKIVESKIIEDDLKNVVIINGIGRDELFKILSVAFLSVNFTTCYEENFGISTIESMTLGLPVIGSDWGGLKDTIKKGGGILLKTKITDHDRVVVDVFHAIKMVKQIANDSVRYNKMVRKCRLIAEKYYSENAFVENMKKIIIAAGDKNEISKDEKILLPASWIKQIYDASLKKGQVGRIYEENPGLFKKLYRFYESKS